ncbi:hypothetical protein, partial [Candidatus Nitrosocosmicus arcticus]|uniref:hypothetical protein n=1 Tax=Candidatus Nitrosocosmicus arcticus TaxID=2035267 RepID=UPI001C98DB87
NLLNLNFRSKQLGCIQKEYSNRERIEIFIDKSIQNILKCIRSFIKKLALLDFNDLCLKWLASLRHDIK